MTDLVLINPGNKTQTYQDLGKDYAAIEPPFWIAVIAAYLRNKGFSIVVIDANAENIAPEETALRAVALRPVLCAVIVYGSQPSASTQNMTIAARICAALKAAGAPAIALGGLHPTALPEQTLRESAIDFVIEGEGFRTLELLIPVLRNGNSVFDQVPGLWHRACDGKITHTTRAPLTDDLDRYLPVAAWDLLPMKSYRAHNWHCFDDLEHRTPYAAIYTSLGCPFSCVFCCINALFGKPGIRFRSPAKVVAELDTLVRDYGIRNVKIVDELFVLNENHYMGIVNKLLERDYRLNIWAYARVDTVNFANLPKMKKAGINWLALGIESANPEVRDGAKKMMRRNDIQQTVQAIRDEGIRVIGNYIFGLPDDTMATMNETIDMALNLNCEFANFYCAMAYPGSQLYEIARRQGWALPTTWDGFSQHAYELMPLPTKYLTAPQVLEFRDNAFRTYFSHPAYLNMIAKTFGPSVRQHVEQMTKTRLKRHLLEK